MKGSNAAALGPGQGPDACQIDDSEPAPAEAVGAWLAMLAAVAVVGVVTAPIWLPVAGVRAVRRLVR